MPTTSLRSAISTVIAMLIVGFATSGRAQTRHQFDVSPQPLSEALNSFAVQAGINLYFDPSDVAGRTAPALKTEATTGEALDMLLSGTELAAVQVDERTVRVTSEDKEAFTRIARLPQGGGPEHSSSSTEDELEVVIVTAGRATTATKTDTRLIEIPQAISVVTSAQISDRGAQLYEEAMRYSAGVAAEPFGVDSRNASTSIRGFETVEYLDGMRRQWGFLNFARTDVYTLERLEVLRGPSSVLYGAGTAGGLVNQVSKRPAFERDGTFSVQYGSYDHKQAQFDITGPLGGNHVWAGRLIGVGRDSHTQVHFTRDDRLLLEPSLTWKVSDNTSATLIGSWTRDKLNSSAQFPPLAAALLAPAGRRLPDDFYASEPGFDKYNVDQASASILVDHSFSSAFKLASAARYVDSTTRYNLVYLDSFTDRDEIAPGLQVFVDPGGETMDRFFEMGEQRSEAFTTDQRLLFKTETGALSHSMLVGVDYQYFSQATDFAFGNAAPLNVYHPVYGNIPTGTLERQPTQWITQLGVYLQDQIRFGDRTHIVLGARRDRAKSASQGQPDQINLENTFRAAIIVNVGHGLSPYLSYAESFLPVAGFVDVDGEFVTFVPQLGTQYEGGIKWQASPRMLTTLAVFDVREKNRFTNHPTDPFAVVQQGEVRSKGAELEVSYELPRDSNFFATYSYVNAEISKSNTPSEIGLQLDVTPKHQASFWGVKQFSLGEQRTLRVGAGVRYIGDSISSGGGTTLDVPSFTLVDALLSVDWRRWLIAINASNLTDKRHYATCLVRGDCWTGARRNVIGSVQFKF